ncbi:N-acetylmuramoyl-L-alanine amidase [Flavonifractor plautii]|uniref:N-acetylmuramoyl-L-alanine amidase n=1 Tax=Flavonifractor plautii TaxID=292800 RepID=UPI001FF622CF|nr:N-acetylmuramoyl-L-alanine amidase [Flavonifractor plautii]UOX46016.1 N-acetylmuramoyl-L-alanine amidase [Flavonifractor plautii]
MSKLITYIPLSSVERIELRVTNCRKTLSQVKAETKAHYVLNGGMWNPDGSACPLLKVGGVMRSGTPWRAVGYAWDKGPDIHMTSGYEGAANFIAVTALISSGKPVDKPSYGSAQGGKRGRSAIGLRGDSLALYCSSDGTDAATPEALRDELAGLGWSSAVMLDGGGSSQCDFGGERITASRKVHNWICVYLKQAGQAPPEQEDKPMSKHTVCLDPGHGPGNVNGSPDGTYKEWEFTWDIAQRVKPLLEAQGVGVVLTKTADNYPSLTERAETSNKAQPDCFVSIHTNAAGEGGWSSASGLEIYTSAGPMTAQRNVLASGLVNAFHAAGVTLRSEPIKHEMYTVLAKTDAPACLIEYGFHTNKADVEYLKDTKYRDKLAEATAKGICTYLNVNWKKDEPVSDWEQERDEAWQAAKEAGILDGTRPEDSVTRQELAVVLDRLNLI